MKLTEITQPDLPYRLKANIPLTPYNRATFETPGEAGYTDYPFAQRVEVLPAIKVTA
jgi:NADPH2 dehydrogenase